MNIAAALRGNVGSDIATVDRGRTGRPDGVRDATTASACAWRIWAGIVLAQILAAVIVGTTPAASAVCVAATVPAALVDVRTRRLPNRLLLIAALALVVGLAISAAAGVGVNVVQVVIGVGVLAGPLLALHLASPTSMGFGDVKAAAVLGAAVGIVHWQLALSALALAAGFSVTAAVLTRARAVPFGPGLVSGAAVALAFSSVLVPGLDDRPLPEPTTAPAEGLR